jgi:predicted amidohydrolase
MKTALLQINPTGNVDENLQKAVMSQHDEQFNRYAEIARSNQIAIALGYLERDEDELFDAVALIDIKGELVQNYRKVHTVRKNWEICCRQAKHSTSQT